MEERESAGFRAMYTGIRSGDYRILYALEGGSRITILDIGHRKDIYR